MIELKAGQTVTHEEISHYAYLLWEEDGKPDGKDVDYWVRAEQILYKSRENGQSSAQTLSPGKATSKAPAAPAKKRVVRKSAAKTTSPKTDSSAKASTRSSKAATTAKAISAKKAKKAPAKKATKKRATKKSAA